MKTFFVYILTNKGKTSLYTGVTNSLMRRLTQHRTSEAPAFTHRYNLDRLVYYESFYDVRDAIAREKLIKGWSRKKKNDLIAIKNPKWVDLSETILGLDSPENAGWHEIPRFRSE